MIHVSYPSACRIFAGKDYQLGKSNSNRLHSFSPIYINISNSYKIFQIFNWTVMILDMFTVSANQRGPRYLVFVVDTCNLGRVAIG